MAAVLRSLDEYIRLVHEYIRLVQRKVDTSTRTPIAA